MAIVPDDDLIDADGDGKVSDDYLAAMRATLRPVIKSYGEDGKKRILSMLGDWRRICEHVGVEDSEDLRAVVLSVLMPLLMEDSSDDALKDSIATLMMTLAATKIRPIAETQREPNPKSV